ncbi:hypothetical protein BJV77DRAFT_960912 [Russula vinacea]|nr:hypothetical protein BJV77DRAFT_960912 [Russula vinacea]
MVYQLPCLHAILQTLALLLHFKTSNETSPLSVTFQTISDGNSMTIAGEPTFPVHKQPPNFMGIHFTTLVLLGAQVLLFAGTLIGWVFAALAFSGSGTPKVHPPGVVNNQNIPPPDPGTSHIFLHVAFAVVSLVQAVLIERRIFRARAERYAFKHPGDMFPTSPQDGQSGPDASMPVAPWNRPPLPTYAAALASSGVGTGDVEDVEIARPPPPAYGKTRGSTLARVYDEIVVRVARACAAIVRSALSVGMRSGSFILSLRKRIGWKGVPSYRMALHEASIIHPILRPLSSVLSDILGPSRSHAFERILATCAEGGHSLITVAHASKNIPQPGHSRQVAEWAREQELQSRWFSDSGNQPLAFKHMVNIS